MDVTILGNDYFPEDFLRGRLFLRKNALLLRYGRYSESFRSQRRKNIDCSFSIEWLSQR